MSDSGHLNPMVQEDNISDSNEGVDLKIMAQNPLGKGSPDTSHDDEEENVIKILFFNKEWVEIRRRHETLDRIK